jgi:hypothetical protein
MFSRAQPTPPHLEFRVLPSSTQARIVGNRFSRSKQASDFCWESAAVSELASCVVYA